MPLLTQRDAAVSDVSDQPTPPPAVTLTRLKSRWCLPQPRKTSSDDSTPPFPPSTQRSFGKAAPVVGLCGGEVAHRPLQEDESPERFEAASARCVFTD